MTAGPGVAPFPAAVEALVEKAQQSERSGRRELSRQYYETALYLLRPGDGAAAVTIVRRLIRSYVDDGQFDVAFDCCELALAIADALEDANAYAHTTNLLAIAHLQRGDLDDATREFSRAFSVGEARPILLCAYKRLDVSDVGAPACGELGYFHHPFAAHEFDHLLRVRPVSSIASTKRRRRTMKR